MEVKRDTHTVDELRAERRAEALSRGTTLEAEMDELERLTHSKQYADCFRLLYGISIRPDETPSA